MTQEKRQRTQKKRYGQFFIKIKTKLLFMQIPAFSDKKSYIFGKISR